MDDKVVYLPQAGRMVGGPGSPRSVEEQAATVALADATSTREAAEVTDIPRRTIRRWAADDNAVAPEARELARELLADECEKIVKAYMEHLLAPAVIAGASARDAGTVVGILVDKAIKLRGEDKPHPLDQPLTMRDYFLSLAAQAAGSAKARAE